ncbi:MAG: hypothetical protein RSF40_11680 [Oscillospiraceae bacterium]
MKQLAVSLFLMIILLNPVQANAIDSFDITTVSDITATELLEYAPKWCELKYCELIVEQSKEYGISSEFATSVFRYEYVAKRNSVGGWTCKGGYEVFDSLEESIKEWFKDMSCTYCDTDSWHYEQTNGTTIYDIAPLYNQGATEYNDNSKFWYKTIEKETRNILELETAAVK